MKYSSPAVGITFALFLFSALSIGQAYAQDAAQAPEAIHTQETAGLEKGMDRYLSEHLQEKLFVHTDKDFYLAGEICWFKLYDVEGSSHHPLDLSKVAYLEWLDKNNKPVLQAKVGLHRGHGDGSFYLPLTLRSGNYKLRAYTSWMKNYGPDWFFEKTVAVVNARKSAEAPLLDPPLQANITFFPEGGNWVENIAGKMAFRVTDLYGQGIACMGVVTEDDADTLLRFHPLRFGIGSFVLTPRPGHRYRATVRLPDGTAINKLLPAAYKEGTVMRVSKEGNDRWRVDVQSTAAGPAGAGADPRVYLIAHTRQSVKLAEAATLREGKTSFLIDKTILGEGVSHLTVFNAARQPVCERLVFRTPSHRLHVVMNADQESYSTRKKINLQLAFTGPDNQPFQADCSLSVYRLDSLQGLPGGHMESYFWLSSDLKGKVESPDYYFDHPEEEEAMDNLMMTHGWRRFGWEEVLHPVPASFEFAPEYKGPIIPGRIVDTRTGAAGKGIQGYLSVPGTRTQFSSAISDSEGRVKFEMKDFYGSREIVVQTDPHKDSLFRIDIANPFLEAYTDNPLSPFIAPPGASETLTDKSVAMQALNRYAGEKLKQFHFPAAADTGVFYYKPDYSYMLDDYTRFITMEEVMREYVVLMLVKKSRSHFHLPLFDLTNNQFFEVDPLILLDGVPVFDIDKLMTLDPLKVRKLDMVHRRYFLGGTDYEGIMNWVTYKGDLGGYTLDPTATAIDYEGLELQREFYAPSYETEQEAGSHLPDFRNVLYWSPIIPTDARGRGVLSFYSSDLPGHYVAVLEGLAPDGTTVSKMVRFEVK